MEYGAPKTRKGLVVELVNIMSVKAGQILARAATNAGGAVLCPAGLRLTDTVIERLRTAGIESLIIEGGQTKGLSPQDRIQALNDRFDGIDDPLLLQIKAVIEKRLNIMQLEQSAHS